MDLGSRKIGDFGLIMGDPEGGSACDLFLDILHCFFFVFFVETLNSLVEEEYSRW